jgi:hypothetical protein
MQVVSGDKECCAIRIHAAAAVAATVVKIAATISSDLVAKQLVNATRI